jgi:RNA polymerase sigma-70 factor (ECF subfamily)
MCALDAEREHQLLKLSLSNPDAFREIYRFYFPRVYAYVASRVDSRKDAEDVVSDTFLDVVRSLRSFQYRGAGSFSAWVFRIAHNRVYQFYQRPPENLLLDDLPEMHSPDPLPDSQFLYREQRDNLHALIAALSPRRQEIIRLRYFGGLNNREIAEALDLDEHTIASHLSRALTDLQRKAQEAQYV